VAVGLGIPFLILAGIFVLIAIVTVFHTLFRGLVNATIGHIPLLGIPLAGAINGVLNAALNPILSWLRGQVVHPIRWIQAIAHAFGQLPHEVVRLGVDVKNAVEYLNKTTVPNKITLKTAPIQKTAEQANTVAAAAGAGVVAEQLARKAGIDKLARDLGAEFERRLRNGIDKLRSDILERTIPAVRGEIATGAKAEGARIGALDERLGRVDADLGKLAKRAGIPLALLEALIAAQGITAVEQALETSVTCRDKLRGICTTNPLDWASFILGFALIAEFPGYHSMVEMGATIVEDAYDAIAELAKS
jgi:hypothetical protein